MGAPPSPLSYDRLREGFRLKRWIVSVTWASGTISEEAITAPTRGKALASAWRCDTFSTVTFGEFLRFARCRRDRVTPPRWGDPITVEGKPAFFLSNNRQYVQIALPDRDHPLNAHPYDVLPVEYRPDTYRDRTAEPAALRALSGTDTGEKVGGAEGGVP